LDLRVVQTEEGYRLDGAGADVVVANGFLTHLGSRRFSALTVRAYAYDLLNFLRFLDEQGASVEAVVPTDRSTIWSGSPDLRGRLWERRWCGWRTGGEQPRPR
jgi:hypothetical protein